MVRIGLLLALTLSLIGCRSNHARYESVHECYKASFALLDKSKWKKHQQFILKVENPRDPVLILHSVCSDIGLGSYSSAKAKLGELQQKGDFPCLEGVIQGWISELERASTLSTTDLMESVAVMLDFLEASKYAPCRKSPPN